VVAPLLLGVNPLIGVDHFSADRAREKMRSGETSDPLAVIRAAVAAGAGGFTFSPGTRVMELLKAARAAGESGPLKLYPLLPALDKYWPVFVSKGTYGLVSAVLEDLSWTAKARTLLKGGTTALTSDPFRALALYVDVELTKIKAAAPPNWTVDAVFLGETFTDMLLSFRSYDLLRSFCTSVEDHRGVRAGLQTLNLARLLGAADQMGLARPPIVMAPFNPRGFQMTPDRESCEQAAAASSGTEFVAISVLAAGQVPLSEAVDYLRPRKAYLSSVVVGTSSPRHATEAFSLLRSALGT
jgi:hypothetical protein